MRLESSGVCHPALAFSSTAELAMINSENASKTFRAQFEPASTPQNISLAIVDGEDACTIASCGTLNVPLAVVGSPALPSLSSQGASPQAPIRLWQNGIEIWQRCSDNVHRCTSLAPRARNSSLKSQVLTHISSTTNAPAVPLYSSCISLVNAAAFLLTRNLPKIIGPLEADNPPAPTPDFKTFLDTHSRVMYIDLGPRSSISHSQIQQIMEGIILAMERQYIDGLIWSTNGLARESFYDVFDKHLNNEDSDWIFVHDGLQPTMLAQSSIRIFLSTCDVAALHKAAWYGVPILALDEIHQYNATFVESLGIARVVLHHRIKCTELSDKIGEIVLDVYGTFRRSRAYMQKVVRDNGKRTQELATTIENFILA